MILAVEVLSLVFSSVTGFFYTTPMYYDARVVGGERYPLYVRHDDGFMIKSEVGGGGGGFLASGSFASEILLLRNSR